MRGARAWSGAQGTIHAASPRRPARKVQLGLLDASSIFQGVSKCFLAYSSRSCVTFVDSIHAINRTQLVSEENSPTKMSDARWELAKSCLFHNPLLSRWAGRESDKRAQEARRRELLVLVHQHLQVVQLLRLEQDKSCCSNDIGTFCCTSCF